MSEEKARLSSGSAMELGRPILCRTAIDPEIVNSAGHPHFLRVGYCLLAGSRERESEDTGLRVNGGASRSRPTGPQSALSITRTRPNPPRFNEVMPWKWAPSLPRPDWGRD